jgi:WD40 repeat protein
MNQKFFFTFLIFTPFFLSPLKAMEEKKIKLSAEDGDLEVPQATTLKKFKLLRDMQEDCPTDTPDTPFLLPGLTKHQIELALRYDENCATLTPAEWCNLDQALNYLGAPDDLQEQKTRDIARAMTRAPLSDFKQLAPFTLNEINNTLKKNLQFLVFPYKVIKTVKPPYSPRHTSLTVHDNNIFTGTWGGLINAWDAHTLTTKQSFFHKGLQSFIAWDTSLATGSRDASIKLWNSHTGTLQHQLQGHTDWINSLTYNGKFLISGSADGTIKVWDPVQGTLIKTLAITSEQPIFTIKVQNNILALRRNKQPIELRDLSTDTTITHLPDSNYATTLALKDYFLVIVYSNKTLQAYDVRTRKLFGEQKNINSFYDQNIGLEHDVVICSDPQQNLIAWDLRTNTTTNLVQNVTTASAPLTDLVLKDSTIFCTTPQGMLIQIKPTPPPSLKESLDTSPLEQTLLLTTMGAVLRSKK